MVCNANINVNIDLCFTLSCELVGRLTILGKYKVLVIVYCANAGAIEGVVGKG